MIFEILCACEGDKVQKGSSFVESLRQKKEKTRTNKGYMILDILRVKSHCFIHLKLSCVKAGLRIGYDSDLDLGNAIS